MQLKNEKMLFLASSINFFFQKKPKVVAVTINNTCNMKCPQCAYATSVPRQRKDMNLNLFSRILRQCEESHVGIIRILGLSEPTLHPNFYDMLVRTAEAGEIFLHVITNGISLITERGRSRMLECPPDLLEVSIDAFSPKVFSVVRGGSSELFNAIVEGTRQFSKLLQIGRKNKKWGGRYPKVSVSFVLHVESLSESSEFLKAWKNRVDTVRFRGAHNFSGRARGLPSQINGKNDYSHGCGYLESRIYIDVEGKVHACTLDFENHFILGDLTKSHTMLNAWYHARRKNLFEAHKKGCDLPTQCVKCSKCSDLL